MAGNGAGQPLVRLDQAFERFTQYEENHQTFRDQVNTLGVSAPLQVAGRACNAGGEKYRGLHRQWLGIFARGKFVLKRRSGSGLFEREGGWWPLCR